MISTTIKTLSKEPPVLLADSDLAQAGQFAQGLFAGNWQSQTTGLHKTLQDLYRSVGGGHTQFFFLDYFMTEAGRTDRQTLGLDKGGTSEVWKQQLYAMAADEQAVDPIVRRQIARRSILWRRQQLAAMLEQDPALDAAFEPFAYAEVNFMPSVLLERLENLQAFWQFYGRLTTDTTFLGANQQLQNALQALLQVHKRRVCGLLREACGAAQALEVQLAQSKQTKAIRHYKQRLQAIMPTILALQETEDLPAQTAALQTFIAQNVVPQTANIGKFTSDELQALDATYWQAEQLKTFFEAVLAKWRLLSSETATWEQVEPRMGTAKDNLFQVVIRPKSSLAISSDKRVVFIPEDFNRSLTSVYPAGVLPVAAHELTHVLQALADAQLARIIPLATIKGHGYRVGREAGGLYQEDALQRLYFGRQRPVNTHYAKAMLAKLAGQTQLAVLRTFYNSYLAANPHQDRARAASLAVDRGLRLYRRNGYYIKPANIIEQAALLHQLSYLTPQQATKFALAGSSFSPQDAVLLHQVGLLQVPKELYFNPVNDVIEVYQKGSFQPKVNE